VRTRGRFLASFNVGMTTLTRGAVVRIDSRAGRASATASTDGAPPITLLRCLITRPLSESFFVYNELPLR
jgi:hypothetical protein